MTRRKVPQTPLEKAAVSWWMMKRPASYTKDDHLNNPTVNCAWRSEYRLAKAVARHIRKRGS